MDKCIYPLHKLCAGGVFYVSTQSTLGLHFAGTGRWRTVGRVVEKWFVLSFAGTSCPVFGDCSMPQKIGGINLSKGEYALVSEVHNP